MKRIALLIISIASLLCSCTDKADAIRILDEEHHSMFFYDVPIVNGYDAIAQKLTESGFIPSGDEIDLDLTIIGGVRTISQTFVCDSISHRDANIISYGLHEFLIPDHCSGRITLVRYPSRQLHEITVCLDDLYMSPESYGMAVSKLKEIFPYSKVSNSSYGYCTYYDDFGNGIYYPSESLIRISFDNK